MPDAPPPTSLVKAAIEGRCPSCGARTLFEAPAMIAGECTSCAEPLAELDKGGRIAGLITMVVAVALILAAMAFDDFVRPPLWVHVVLWTPLTIGSVLFVLRYYKAAGVYRAYEKKRTAHVQSEPR
ncbi:MAG: DUF983 domain-containing protein [Pseudomonadota bacterium]